MEFHGEFSMEIHGIPWNSMEVFHTGPVGKKYTSKEKKSTKFIFEQILNTVFWGYF